MFYLLITFIVVAISFGGIVALHKAGKITGIQAFLLGMAAGFFCLLWPVLLHLTFYIVLFYLAYRFVVKPVLAHIREKVAA